MFRLLNFAVLPLLLLNSFGFNLKTDRSHAMKKSNKEIVAAVLNSLQSKDESIVLAYKTISNITWVLKTAGKAC